MSTVRRVLACAGLGLGLLMFTTPALAQTYTDTYTYTYTDTYTYTYTGVQPPALGSAFGKSAHAPTPELAPVSASRISAAGVPVVQARAGRLAVTRDDVVSVVLFAVAVIVLGTVFTRRARSRPARRY